MAGIEFKRMKPQRPQPDWLAPTQCIGKHRFDSQAIAKQVAKRMARTHESSTSAYKCATCGGWHVGNNKGNKKS